MPSVIASLLIGGIVGLGGFWGWLIWPEKSWGEDYGLPSRAPKGRTSKLIQEAERQMLGMKRAS